MFYSQWQNSFQLFICFDPAFTLAPNNRTGFISIDRADSASFSNKYTQFNQAYSTRHMFKIRMELGGEQNFQWRKWQFNLVSSSNRVFLRQLIWQAQNSGRYISLHTFNITQKTMVFNLKQLARCCFETDMGFSFSLFTAFWWAWNKLRTLFLSMKWTY